MDAHLHMAILNAIEGNYLDQTWGFQVGKHLNDDVTSIAKVEWVANIL